MTFVHRQKVLFRHCDPAGIVFFPRYFEMLNDAVEAFFDEVLQMPFERLHPAAAVPTAAIEATFRAPSRHGDLLDIALSPGTPGGSSLGLTFAVTCDGAARLDARSTIVYVDGAGRPAPWPRTIRDRLTPDREDTR